MIRYSSNGIALTIPKKLHKNVDFPSLVLVDPESKSSCSVMLNAWKGSFKELYQREYSPDAADVFGEVIKTSNYDKIKGAKEVLYKRVYPEAGFYGCNILIPVGDYSATVKILFDNDLDIITRIWRPIIDTIDFDSDAINKLIIEGVQHDWTKETESHESFAYSFFTADGGMVGISDSSVKLFQLDTDDDEYLEMADYDDIFDQDHFAKYDNRLVLGALSPLDNWPGTFHYKADAPDVCEWDYVIEGSIGIESGTLCGTCGEGPSIQIKMNPGIYTFKVYFRRYDGELWRREANEEGRECFHIYFWPTDEPETNNVRIIKPYVS